MHALGTLILLAALPAWLPAQEPETVKIDSPQARVLMVTEQPHVRGPQRDYPVNRVLIYLDAGEMTRTSPGGKADRIRFQAGDVRWSPAEGPAVMEITSGQPVHIIEIELKNRPQPSVPMTDLEPAKADPKHYKLEFENGQVRVLRVRYGPHEDGVRHEHKLNHLVIYLTDQAKGKRGEVHLDEPTIHSEQNPLDHAVERIAVDLK